MSTFRENGFLTVDLHDLEVDTARRYLKGVLDKLPQGAAEITVIHGYRQGKALQKMVRNSFAHKRLAGKRLGLNQGVTYLLLK